MSRTQTQYGSQATSNTMVRIGVGVIISDPAGRLLLEKRSDCGRWGLPGGRIEPGETVEQTARREVKEETGLDIEVTSLIGVYSHPVGRIVQYPGDSYSVHLVDVILAAQIKGGVLSRSAESLELTFFAPNDLPDNLVPPAINPIHDFCLGHSCVIR